MGEGFRVAPFAGAWIETHIALRAAATEAGRPLRGGVDRNSAPSPMDFGPGCRPLRGGVDRNPVDRGPRPPAGGRPLRGGVDRNRLEPESASSLRRRPLRGGVDRNDRALGKARLSGRRPLRGGVDRNQRIPMEFAMAARRPLRGGVDRNPQNVIGGMICRVSPPSRERGSKRCPLGLPRVFHPVATGARWGGDPTPNLEPVEGRVFRLRSG